MGPLGGFIQVLGLPVLNGIIIAAILYRYDATLLVPGLVTAVYVLNGGNRFDGLNRGVTLIIGLRGDRCAGKQQGGAYSQNKFRLHHLLHHECLVLGELRMHRCFRTKFITLHTIG